jgi:hypothetical protein
MPIAVIANRQSSLSALSLYALAIVGSSRSSQKLKSSLALLEMKGAHLLPEKIN